MTRWFASAPLASLTSTHPLDLVPRCSLLVPLALVDRRIALLAVVPVAVVVLSPRLYRHPVLWLTYAAAFGLPQAVNWHGVDNHNFLVAYWLMALGLAFATSDPGRALDTSGRLLVGLVFLFAVIWKVAPGQVLDGDFFHHAILLDPRLEAVGRWAAGIGPATQEANLWAWATLTAPDSTATSIQLADTGRARPIALVMSWWGVGLEAAIAAVFLAPVRHRLIGPARAAALVTFAVTTYAVIPVTTFGAVLMLMGYAQAEAAGRTRAAHLGALAFVVAWAPIWDRVTSLA